jgi:hypothetical protein
MKLRANHSLADFREISQSGANVEFQKAILLQIAIRKEERT